MKINKLKCFGIDSNSGNLAYVIQNDNLNHEQRQEYAKQIYNSRN